MAQLHEKVDIVTAGGGWTAAILAQRILPGTRHTMVSLEQGSARWTYPEFAHNHDSLRYSARYAMMVDLNREAWTWRPNPSKPSLPMRQYGSFHPGAGVGGAAVHWSAQLWRYLPTDFRYRSHVIERYGKDKLPDGVQVQDWGITYDELEPYYDAFEYDIGASGHTGNLNGHILPGGNPFEAPRARPYPNPPLATNAYADLFGEAARSVGCHPFPQPAGILSRAWTDPFGHDRSACLYCGFCTRFGCEVDAKSSPITTHLPVALETGRYEIRTGCKVVGIEVADNGMATGLRYVDSRGDEHVQPAEVVVLSAFTFTNNKLLLVSRSKKHPDGVGNDRGRVGKNYTYQQYNSPVKGLWQGRRFNMYMGNTCTINIVYDYYGDVFDHSDLDFIGGSQIFSQPCEREPVTSAGGMFEHLMDRQWGQQWKDRLRDSWDGTATLNLEGESLPYDDQFLDLDPKYKDSWGLPLLRLSFDWHDNDYKLFAFMKKKSSEIMRAMNPTRMVELDLKPYNIHDYQSTHPTGGCIMGSDPSKSVTNNFGQVWDTPNVFVTGAALYPQNPAANPTGTLAALAYRTADAIRRTYFDHPGELMDDGAQGAPPPRQPVVPQP
jgi:gluconate 2-dehydrogenase alpha chain